LRMGLVTIASVHRLVPASSSPEPQTMLRSRHKRPVGISLTIDLVDDGITRR
jgi:hypothetical protein